MKSWFYHPNTAWILLALIIILIAAFGYGYYRFDLLSKDLANTQAQFASSTAAFEQQVANLQASLTQAGGELANLANNLQAEQDKNEFFAGQINEISGTVGQLDKLSKTDEELLQKYSMVYFLNEHYLPSRLSPIEDRYKSDPDKNGLLIHSDVWPHLLSLLQDAAGHDIDLRISSAFRSFSSQSELKADYQITYGYGANQFAADQGYSEHQLGTTVDLVLAGAEPGLSEDFADTEAYQWLLDNAHEHGFTLSYPEGNEYYVFEPWHWRYVGVELATDLHNDNKHFYDLEQRKIDEYLIKIFD
ncbi:MAG: M15 family metallopeptidase [Patescibacteria group bacterium]|nr:M15 family metallopeptidase [Patescibacteria group bacterium]